MKAKEIEKLIRVYVPAKTLLGSNRAKFIAELQELHQVGVREQLKNHGVIGDVMNTICPNCGDNEVMNHNDYKKSTCVKCGFQWQNES